MTKEQKALLNPWICTNNFVHVLFLLPTLKEEDS